MRILAVDVGTGTQDILLFDSEKEIENCVKMVMPSPTAIVAQEIRRATARGEDLLLTGVTMGGGPCRWAAHDHIKAGYRVYATPDAARTFDDDLTEVERMGVRIVEEVKGLSHLRRIEMKDFDYEAVAMALRAFHVEPEWDALAVGVLDHGAAPPGVSDRAFRFDYLAQRVREQNRLSAFAFMREEIPPIMTRMRAVAQSVEEALPLMLMDTAPAAVLGALEDERVNSENNSLVVNIGNLHTLAFHLAEGKIAGLFEHHTGRLSPAKLEDYLEKLAQGTITNEEVFADHGHGALIVARQPVEPSFLAVTGPRRSLMRGSTLSPYYAVPHGDMMLVGCFGLIRALAQKAPAFAPEIEGALGSF